MTLRDRFGGMASKTLLFQIVSSVSNLAIVMYLATALNTREFGAYALPSALWATVSGVVQLSLVMVSIYSWSTTETAPVKASGYSTALLSWCALLSLAVVGVFGLREAVAGVTCGIVMVLYDATKRLFVAQAAVLRVVAVDVSCLVVAISLFAAVLPYQATGSFALFLQGAVYFAGWIALVIFGPARFALHVFSWHRAAKWGYEMRVRLSSSVLGSSLATAGSQVAIILLAAASPTAIAGYRLLQSLFGPISMVSSALALTYSERVIRAGILDRFRLAFKMASVLWLTTACATGLILVGAPLLVDLIGPTWVLASASVIPYAILMLVLQVNFSVQMIIRSGRSTLPIVISGVLGGAGYVLAVLLPISEDLSLTLLLMASLQIPAIAYGIGWSLWYNMNGKSR